MYSSVSTFPNTLISSVFSCIAALLRGPSVHLLVHFICRPDAELQAKVPNCTVILTYQHIKASSLTEVNELCQNDVSTSSSPKSTVCVVFTKKSKQPRRLQYDPNISDSVLMHSSTFVIQVFSELTIVRGCQW